MALPIACVVKRLCKLAQADGIPRLGQASIVPLARVAINDGSLTAYSPRAKQADRRIAKERHGTTTLFAALDVLTGQVLAHCKPRHRHQEFLGFLRAIEAAVSTDLDIHLIVDNHSTHKHPKVKAWLAARPRWHLHFVPIYSSWLNLVERFFALITGRAIRRGSFRSVRELIQRIDHFVANHNIDCKPFIWTATADSILAKLQRPSMRISGTAH